LAIIAPLSGTLVGIRGVFTCHAVKDVKPSRGREGLERGRKMVYNFVDTEVVAFANARNSACSAR
jgi:hypothetical protein